jgi:hypothetical protein
VRDAWRWRQLAARVSYRRQARPAYGCTVVGPYYSCSICIWQASPAISSRSKALGGAVVDRASFAAQRGRANARTCADRQAGRIAIRSS